MVKEELWFAERDRAVAAEARIVELEARLERHRLLYAECVVCKAALVAEEDLSPSQPSPGSSSGSSAGPSGASDVVEPVRHMFAGILCVTIPAESYDRLRGRRPAAAPKVDCDNCHGTGHWHDIVFDIQRQCPCVSGVAMKAQRTSEAPISVGDLVRRRGIGRVTRRYRRGNEPTDRVDVLWNEGGQHTETEIWEYPLSLERVPRTTEAGLCRACLGGRGECTCPTEALPPRVTPTPNQLRILATRLEDRYSAPSLKGYGLVDGLRAAAALLDGLHGPMVHEDCLTAIAFGGLVPLTMLLGPP